MTKAQFTKKAKELYKSQITDGYIQQEIDKALNSGALELKDWEDDYVLPKAFIHALFIELAFQYRPWTNKGKKASKQLQLIL